MIRDDASTRKRVKIADVRPGMYVVGLDRPWLQTPFLFHRKLLHRSEEIDQLKQHGIREVVIDTARGADVSEAADANPATGDVSATSHGDVPAIDGQGAAAQPQPLTAERVLQPIAREIDHARSIHQEALTLAQTIFEGAGGGVPIDCKVTARVATSLQDSVVRSPEAHLLLMQMRRFQKDLFTHAVNVCVLSLVVAMTEDFGDNLEALAVGALLHDIGEIRLPRSLLHKSSNYTDVEAKMLNQHPVLGAALLGQSEGFSLLAQRIVLDHHERIDGTGYPRGAQAADLSVYSQIVALTDSYDDMLSGRNRTALPPTEVLRQLFLQANSGSADRSLVEKVIRSLGVYPIGSVVELNTGERGVVVATNRTVALKPIVRIIMSSSGRVHHHGPIISLADAARGSIERRIVGVLDPVKERIDPLLFMRLAPGGLG